MENPKCPYCGEKMDYYFDDNPMLPEGYYYCKCCGSRAPTATTEKAAYVGAMDRFPQGRWVYDKAGKWSCSECQGWNDWRSDFCPNCGADMRKEVNDGEI